MRSILVAVVSAAVVLTCAYLSARQETDSVKVRVRLMDAKTGTPVAGIVRITPKGQETPLALAGLYPRLRGLKVAAGVAGWHVVPATGAETTLPRSELRLEALSGLETALTTVQADLRKNPPQEIVFRLDSVFRPADHGLVAGNTHLHLMKLPEKDADDYLRQIPAADGLRVMFISYLERHKDDVDYVTNRYPVGDLPAFNATGVLFNNGEEHRHNFGGYGEGYGHVMFLNIKSLVKPVSLGPGITGGGTDDRALRPGIDEAREQGATIIWCHNGFGFEDVPSVLTGRLDALNVFDGSRRGSFHEPYYRYLNIGLELPISTGTDWFIYDFARVYAQVRGKLTVRAWLEALKAGRCQVTNGPLLSLRVNGLEIGDVVQLDKPGKVRVEASAVGRHNFQDLQLVHNGNVVQLKPTGGQEKQPYRTHFVHELRIDEPGWVALRIDSTTKNELDQQLFAHSSPIYIRLAGKSPFDVDAARALLKQVEEAEAAIRAQAKFSTAEANSRLLALYRQAADDLKTRIAERGR